MIACFWWAGVLLYHIGRPPHALAPYPFIDWDQTQLVLEAAPLMMVPFLVFATWPFAAYFGIRGVAVPPAWLTWTTGAAAFSWIGFALWRAHDQAFTCAVWAPRELLSTSTICSLPHLLASMLLWLLIPFAAWLILAARRSSRAA